MENLTPLQCERLKEAEGEIRLLKRQISHLKELAQRDPVALLVAIQGLDVDRG